jgi:hypothetical protein
VNALFVSDVCYGGVKVLNELQCQCDLRSIKLSSFLAEDLHLSQLTPEVPSTHVVQYKEEMVL